MPAIPMTVFLYFIEGFTNAIIIINDLLKYNLAKILLNINYFVKGILQSVRDSHHLLTSV